MDDSRVPFVVVGSGPSGVEAASALLDEGQPVTLVDAGEPPSLVLPSAGGFLDLRRGDPGQWKWLLGPDFEMFDGMEVASPKMRVPQHQYVFRGFAEANRLETEDFSAVGSLARGGLSNAWGAGISCFDAEELRCLPVDSAVMAAAYREIAQRIGVSGSDADDLGGFHGRGLPLQPPGPLSPGPKRLLGNYRRRRDAPWARGFALGHGRNAVLTEPLGGRSPCRRLGLCLWGCPGRAIYAASYDLERLTARPGFRYLGGMWAESLEVEADGVALELVDRADGSRRRLRTSRLLLAAGALGSARLVMRALQRIDRDGPLLTSPVMRFALFLPHRFGAAVEAESFNLAQLSFAVQVDREPVGHASGNLFPGSGIPVGELARHIPMARPAALVLSRLLAPAILLGNCFLPGGFGRHRLRLATSGALQIRGGWESGYQAWTEALGRRLVRAFRGCGGWVLPGSVGLLAPGEDIHYAGTLPMRIRPEVGECDAEGGVVGLPGVFVVDAAALPLLPGRAHTFTAMALARVIGRKLAISGHPSPRG
ncbi:MAG: GMC family oxidoreductase [Magnetococcales bacterium]|nr:GMC family oxidoreductase [Magnetococcales bacterium]MBF0157215.1 GMC family oxidoreductase [Magnetococcales bacterium]